MSRRHLSLAEWSSASPKGHEVLAGLALPSDGRMDLAIQRLAQAHILEVTETKHGLNVTSFSWVGRLEVGDLVVTVRPKIDAFPLMRLLRYAYGLRQISILDYSAFSFDSNPFQDLLVLQLVDEATELLSRGLHHRYLPRDESLEVLRGRVDFARLASNGGITSAALPCRHHPRQVDNPLNRVLRSGLRLAASLTGDSWLKGEATLLERAMSDVSLTRLDAVAVGRARQSLDRMTQSYDATLRLVELLLEGNSISLDEDPGVAEIHGFMFDMNRFFQALLARLLGAYLPPGHTLVEEGQLRGMFRYSTLANPQHRRSPRPRPDFAVRVGTKTVALLDAKYRDLWATALPREMLYQLALYALGHEEVNQAIILYPTTGDCAQEQQIDVCAAVGGAHHASVALRHVPLLELARLLDLEPSPAAQRSLRLLVETLVCGP